MNREKLQDIKSKLGKVFDTGIGEAYHIYISDLVEALLEDDPPAKIDTTLRGWVLWTRSQDDDMRFVMWASDKGLCESPDSLQPMFDWREFEIRHETLTLLTPEDIGYKVRRYREWSLDEQDKFSTSEFKYKSELADLAIDIATRREG